MDPQNVAAIVKQAPLQLEIAVRHKNYQHVYNAISAVVWEQTDLTDQIRNLILLAQCTFVRLYSHLVEATRRVPCVSE